MEKGNDAEMAEEVNNADGDEEILIKQEIKDSEPLPDEENEMPPSPSKIDVARAQEELTNLDVLVCGKCHNVFHFIKELQIHKASGCPGYSDVFNSTTKTDSKAQVWGFVLYKATKLKEHGHAGDWSTVSWQCYQKWSKLSEHVKQSWVEAGRAIQQLSVFSPTKNTPTQIQVPIKKAKPMLTAAERQEHQQTLLELQKELEGDETEMMSTLGLVRGKGRDEKEKAGINQIWTKRKSPEGDEIHEELRTVEKIVAKRVNPKARTPEYLIKWEGLPSDENTWEPVHNMTTCIKLVQEFEKNLAKQKARKAMEASKQLGKQIMVQDISLNSPNHPGRPQRSSAKKALDQVKQWVGSSKRSLESEDDDEADDDDGQPPPKKESGMDIGALLKKKLGIATGKGSLMHADSGGVVRIDPKTVPNLSSGVYILSSQQGLIKVDDPTAAKLTEAMKIEGRKVASERTMMIHETEVRKIPAGTATPKVGLFRQSDVTIAKKNNLSPAVKIIQKPRVAQTVMRVAQRNVATTNSPIARQIILGNPKPRPLPGPVSSPLRPPIIKQRVGLKPGIPATATIRTKALGQPRQIHIMTTKDREKLSDDDFDGGIPDEFPKDDEPIAPLSPSRPLTLCPLTGEVLGRAEGEKTPPQQDEDGIQIEGDEDGMMRVEVSPGGSISQVFTRASNQQKPQQRSLLAQRRAIKVEQEQQIAENSQEQEMISIQSEDGVIYQITPEQQQMLLQNGSLTMQEKGDEVSTVVLPQEGASDEHTEILLENGQIVRQVVGGAEGLENAQDEQAMLISGQALIEGEDGQVYGSGNVLTLDSAVQEAVSQVPAEQAEGNKGDDSQQLVAQIVQAEPPTPGGGPRKVVLLLPDGSFINTEMDEEHYQALEFEK